MCVDGETLRKGPTLISLCVYLFWAKRQVRGVKESPEMVRCCLSERLNMLNSAIESFTRVESNAPRRL